MVVVMEMDSGRVVPEESHLVYDDEVLNAGWADVPRIEPRLEELAATRHEPSECEIEGFLARLYAAQE